MSSRQLITREAEPRETAEAVQISFGIGRTPLKRGVNEMAPGIRSRTGGYEAHFIGHPRMDLGSRTSRCAFERRILLEAGARVQHIHHCQGPWNVDLRTPPGPEGSNGSLLDICRGHPGLEIYDLRFTTGDWNRKANARVNHKS